MKYSQFNLLFPNENKQDAYFFFNTFTGATFQIDDAYKRLIEIGDIDLLSKNDIETYKQFGFLVEDIDETKYFSYAFHKSKFQSTVLSLTLLLTHQCNLNCIYCFQGAGENHTGSLSAETQEHLLKFITTQLKANKLDHLHLVLFGGEPLLNFSAYYEWLDQIQTYCNANTINFSTSLITNGTLVTHEIIDNLIRYNCKTVQITLDGVKEIHDKRRMYKSGEGSFELIIENLKLIASRTDIDPPVIRINIDKENIQETKALLHFLYDNGLQNCYIDYGIVKGGTEACASYAGNCFVDEEVGAILNQLWKIQKDIGFDVSTFMQRKNMYCGLYSDHAYTITPKGEVYKCWEHVGDEKHLMGQINEHGEHVNHSFAFFDWMSRNPVDTAECKSCKYLPACGGGCGSISYANEGHYHSKGCHKTIGVIEHQINMKFNF